MIPNKRDYVILSAVLLLMLALQWYFNGWRFAL